ncbi:MAG TPA: hypothetical protein VL463_29700 [Kofleriaceae bacterium]|jgi:hypothetical protein|nr:hypothetical protein [Kofleriaceae bacterium]
MSRASRRAVRAPDLTSLFDVLFLFVFVSLVNAGVTKQEADRAVAATIPKPVRKDFAGLRDQAVKTLAARNEVAARITKDGQLEKLELADRSIPVGVGLVARVADPDVGVVYEGEQNPALRVCALVAHALGTNDLRGYLVIIAPAAKTETLSHALVDGLRADVDRCFDELRGVAVIVEP